MSVVGVRDWVENPEGVLPVFPARMLSPEAGFTTMDVSGSRLSRVLRRVRRRFSLQLGVVPFVILVCTILIALDAYHIWGLRAGDLADAQKAMVNLSRSLGQQAEDTVRTADISLLGSMQRLQIDGSGPDTVGKLRQIMLARLAAFPALATFVITDSTGKCLTTGLPSTPDDCSLVGRADYEYHRGHDDHELHLSPPLQGVSGAWVIPLSRRFNHSDGSFAGVIVVGLSISYFTSYYETFELGPRGAILLALVDGTLLVRRPFVEANVGRKLINGGLFRNYLPKSPTGVAEITSSTDGIVRLNAYRLMEPYPLLISVAESTDDLLMPWRATLWRHFAVTAGLIAIVGFMGWRIAAQSRERRQLEQAYQLLAENSTDVIMRIGPDSKRIYLSPSIRDLTGYAPEELLNGPHGGLIHPDDRATWAASFADAKSGITRGTYRMVRKDGSYVWVEATRRELPDGGYVASIRDISARKVAEDRLAEANLQLEILARQDGLTGLANRRQFDETLEVEIRRAIRDQTPLSLIMIDVDSFKAFNDYYGHHAGDDCLRRVGLALMDTSHRPADLSARYGGEEFVLLLPNTAESGALAIAERARRAVRSLEIEHLPTPEKIVTISLGVASVVPANGPDDAGGLVKAADKALYASKMRGRDRVSSMTPPADATVVD
jgi:diguanylate cyclase (GGDEF)-like protein/PAS domain S-box-containing protein